jgi:hypothetical protein
MTPTLTIDVHKHKPNNNNLNFDEYISLKNTFSQLGTIVKVMFTLGAIT